MTAPEIPDLARQHGAHWAKQQTEDELMKMETTDYTDHHSNSDDLHDYYRHQDGKFPDPFQWRVAAGAVLVWLLIALFVAWVV